MGINFRRGDGRVTQEFLNDAKVRAIFEQMSCETVAQHVGRDVSSNASATDALFDAKPEGNRGKRSAALGKKDVGRRAGCDEFGTADRDVTLEGGDRFFAQWQDALFVTFADDIDETSFEMELFETYAA